MVNLIEALGYTNERVHTGMICYMVQLFNSGVTEPLSLFMKALEPDYVPCGQIRAVPEWENIDLVLFEEKGKGQDGARGPHVAFEMKVDSSEHKARVRGAKESKWQTEVYADRLGARSENRRYFVTLGAGEFYAGPKSPSFKHIPLAQFAEAAREAVRVPCKPVELFPLKAWSVALDSELSLRERIAAQEYSAVANDPKLSAHTRCGIWNAYVLASIRNVLVKDCPEAEPTPDFRVGLNPKFYFRGSGPDTILNIWWSRGLGPGEGKTYLYAEINSNGLLNIKIEFNPQHEAPRRGQIVADLRTRIASNLTDLRVDTNPRSRDGATRTLASVGVGLVTRADFPGLVVADGKDAWSVAALIEEVVGRLRAIGDAALT